MEKEEVVNVIETIDFVIKIVRDKNGNLVCIKKAREFPSSIKRFNIEKNVLKEWENFNKILPTQFLIPPTKIKENFFIQPYLQPYIPNENEVKKMLEKWYEFWGVTVSHVDFHNILKETVTFLQSSLPEERINSPLYKEVIKEIPEKFKGIYSGHLSKIHGNLTFENFKRDENGNLYLIDFDFSEEGYVEDDVSRFKVDSIITKPIPTTLKFFEKLESDLEKDNILNKSTTKAFDVINYLKRLPYTKYYHSDAERDLFDLFLVNSIETLYNKPLTTIPLPERKIRVLNISWGLPGGVNTYIETYTKPLERLGFEFYEIGCSFDENEENPIFSIRKGENFEKVSKELVKELLEKSDFDLINIHNYYIAFPLQKEENFFEMIKNVRKKKKIPIVYTMHGHLKEIFEQAGIKDSESPYLRAEKELLEESDIIISNSYLKKSLSKTMPALLKKHRVVEPASNIANICDKILKKKLTNFTEDTWIISYIGRISESKGIMEAIDAVGLLNKNGFKSVLLLVGPMQAEEIMKNLPPYVFYCGEKNREDVVSYIKASHITVQPTYYDSFNLSVYESLVCGTPVVASERAGITHYFSKYITRFEWSDDYEERVKYLSNALEYVMENYEEIKEYTEIGRKELLFGFHPIKMAYDIGRCYLDVIKSYSS